MTDVISESIELSIVVPAHNEEHRLAKTSQKMATWCESFRPSSESLIVENASTDETLSLAIQLARAIPTVRLLRCSKTGKGHAVKTAILAARGTYVLFMDADGAAPPNEIARLLNSLEDGIDLVVASRSHDTNGHTRVKRSVGRAFLSRALQLLIALTCPSNVSDAMCG